ncbi:unnamed protein product [Caenorhabditis auriculariae]|uniref:Uncharacterized protein n=1 Tax=Caenorhabditis auriculariae TaxID=2777116 RepID=A0A8S1GUH6_9PELO|nr:unnamed protein product [Caenorhabditis auriculariae]
MFARIAVYRNLGLRSIQGTLEIDSPRISNHIRSLKYSLLLLHSQGACKIMVSNTPSPDFVDLWKRSEKSGLDEKSRVADETSLSRSSLTERFSGKRSAIWANMSMLSRSDQAQLMSRLSTEWPYATERRTVSWPLHVGLFANCVTASLISTRINAETFSSPFVFAVYSSGLTYYVMYQMMVTPQVFNETRPCASCLLTNSVAIGLLTGVALPMLSTPYLAHYVQMQREGAGSRLPEVKNALEFLTLGWEGTRSTRGLLLKVVPLQVLIASASAYSLLWGRERIFQTIDSDPEMAKEIFLKAQLQTSFKHKVVEYLRKLPIFGGLVEDSPEKQPH